MPRKSPSAWDEGLLLETDAEATPDVADVSGVGGPDVGRLGWERQIGDSRWIREGKRWLSYLVSSATVLLGCY